jgi:hypothetical protein
VSACVPTNWKSDESLVGQVYAQVGAPDGLGAAAAYAVDAAVRIIAKTDRTRMMNDVDGARRTVPKGEGQKSEPNLSDRACAAFIRVPSHHSSVRRVVMRSK